MESKFEFDPPALSYQQKKIFSSYDDHDHDHDQDRADDTSGLIFRGVGVAGVGGGDIWTWTWDRTLKLLVFSPIVLFTILGNLLVLFAFLTRKRELRSPTHFFIANLSLADFLVGVLVMPFLATLHVTDRWYFGQAFCYSWIIIHFWLCSASILSTCAVCIERYTGVKYPLKHLNIMNQRRVYGMILFVWAFAGFLTVTSVLAFPEESSDEPYVCRINMQIGHVLIATIGILYIPAIIMVILYWRIYTIATKHLNDLKAAHGQTRKSNGDTGKKPFGVQNSTEESGFSSSASASADLKSPKVKSAATEEPTPTPTPTPMPTGTSDAEKKPEDFEKLSLYQRLAILLKPKRDLGLGLGLQKKDLEMGERPSETSVIVTSDESSGSGHIQTPKSVSGVGVTSGSSSGRNGSSTPSASTRKQINLAKRLALLVTVLLASYVPFFTVFLIRAFSLQSVPDWLFITLGWIRYANSSINPIIYAYAVPAYRKAFTSILSGKLRG